jgi:hypothetical protein
VNVSLRIKRNPVYTKIRTRPNTDESGYTYIRAKIITDGGIAQEYAQLTADSLNEIIDEIGKTQAQLDVYVEERDNPSESD